MDKLNEILQEVGISKVKLAKYLGVSRQMIYNYLEMNDISRWPKDKKMKLFNLLDIKEASDINNIKVDAEFINKVDDMKKFLELMKEFKSLNYDSKKEIAVDTFGDDYWKYI